MTWHRDIRPKKRTVCFDVSSSDNHAPVVLWSCHGMQGNQEWKYNYVSCHPFSLEYISILQESSAPKSLFWFTYQVSLSKNLSINDRELSLAEIKSDKSQKHSYCIILEKYFIEIIKMIFYFGNNLIFHYHNHFAIPILENHNTVIFKCLNLYECQYNFSFKYDTIFTNGSMLLIVGLRSSKLDFIYYRELFPF